MPILSIAQTIVEIHQADILKVLGSRAMPTQDDKGMIQLTLATDDPEQKAAFLRLQHLTGVIVEY